MKIRENNKNFDVDDRTGRQHPSFKNIISSIRGDNLGINKNNDIDEMHYVSSFPYHSYVLDKIVPCHKCGENIRTIVENSVRKTRLKVSTTQICESSNNNYSHTRRKWFKKMICKYSSSMQSLFLTLLLLFTLFSHVQETASSVAFDYVPHPEFVEKPGDLNVTSYIDQTTRLPCTIRHLGNKRVSWIRGRDLQVLSTGRNTFATDIRISILAGVSNSKKHSKKKRNVRKVIESRQRFRRSPSSYSPSFFSKGVFDHAWTSSGRKRHRTDRTSYLPSDYRGGYIMDVFNDTMSSKFSSGLHFPYEEVMSDANYRKMFREATEVPRITTPHSVISIHPSSADPTPANMNRRTIVPYNYLDDIWDPEDYTLQIKYTKRSDSGIYVCQVNTDPRVTQAIRLKVVDMVAKIEGQKELFVKEGSPVVLVCKVNGKNLPGFIFWFKDNVLVDYDSSRGRVKVDTTPNGRSKLVLQKARREDSANYTCDPSGGKSASTILTVIEDERPAAMQKGGSISAMSPCVNLIAIFIQCLLIASIARFMSSVEPFRDLGSR